MKKLIGLVLLLTAVCSFAESLPEEQIAQIAARFAAVNTIETRFTQEKHMALLEEPVHSEGVFYFQKPGRIRWQYTKPFQNGFLIIGDKTYHLEKDQKEEQKNPLAYNIASQMLVWITFDLEKLSKQYKVTPRENGVVLVPLSKGIIERIEVTFAVENPQALSKVEVIETTQDKTVLHFINPKTNQPLAPEVFE